MPRILIDVSQEWLNRLQQVLPAAIDTLSGLEHQVHTSIIEGVPDPLDLLDQIGSQLTDLRRSIESARVIF